MLIPFDTQPRGTPVMVPYEGPNGERYEYHAVEEGGGYEAEFYRCPYGDPVAVVWIDGEWHWQVERDALLDALAASQAENERLRKDAARYRYIRDNLASTRSLRIDSTRELHLRSPYGRFRNLDDAIDAKIAELPQVYHPAAD